MFWRKQEDLGIIGENYLSDPKSSENEGKKMRFIFGEKKEKSENAFQDSDDLKILINSVFDCLSKDIDHQNIEIDNLKEEINKLKEEIKKKESVKDGYGEQKKEKEIEKFEEGKDIPDIAKKIRERYSIASENMQKESIKIAKKIR